ncbi:MAG TPA: hypothetical protein VLW85_09055 [Myxococcales bacterium]|nr:hypothetical protein [Myxococcales bacterium]
MSAEIISIAEFRARRVAAALVSPDALAVAAIDRTDLADASRALAASIEAVRQQALALHRARARKVMKDGSKL